MQSKILTILICSIAMFSINAQDYALPVFGDKIIDYYWSADDSTSQVELWENGKVKTNYESIDDKLKLRYDYNEDGTLKQKFEVYQKFKTDTSSVIDLETYQESIVISKGITDIPHGSYEEYYYKKRSKKSKPKTRGRYEDGKKVGEWYYRDFSSSPYTTLATYIMGRLDGQFVIYYPSREFDGEKVKYKGNYKLIGRTKKNNGSSHRVGEWAHYKRSGELVQTVTYKREKI